MMATLGGRLEDDEDVGRVGFSEGGHAKCRGAGGSP